MFMAAPQISPEIALAENMSQISEGQKPQGMRYLQVSTRVADSD